jgi:hypothetical protein
MDDYFDSATVARVALEWAIATRVQLARWEPLIAARLREESYKIPFPAAGYWEAHREWHFCLIAARNLIRALDRLDPPFTMDQVLREITEVRDLNEHWEENAPVFNVTPRPNKPKRQSGKAFAARNPSRGPYDWLAWDSRSGPKLTPNVPAAAVHALLDRVYARVLNDYPELAEFIPPSSPSPWIDNPERDGWEPRPPEAEEPRPQGTE